MKILNFGSLNIDHVYKVVHFVRPGETLGSLSYEQFCGGKGLNQSIALAYADAPVYHAGKIGYDGQMLLDKMSDAGVDIQYVIKTDDVSGHAVIQVDEKGQNCILLHGGTNKQIKKNEIDSVLEQFKEGDYLLLQNEINMTGYIMERAKHKGMKIVINPAPMNKDVFDYPLRLVDIFIVNEIEGSELTGQSDPDLILDKMKEKYPKAAVVLTLGPKGVRYRGKDEEHSVPADTKVKVVDTTAAGDTFIGYFLGMLTKDKSVLEALRTACRACDICVSRAGASSSIPRMSEIIIE